MNTHTFSLLLIALLVVTVCRSQEKKSIAEALAPLCHTDVNAAISYYEQLKKESPNAYTFDDENELNTLGYQLLNEKKTEAAIRIFKLLVSEFPQSSNAYDSLGEAYLRNQNEGLAIENYRKSLELDPHNQNAERVLTDLRFQNRDRGKFYEVYPLAQYREDLFELAQTLTKTNPHPYKFMSKEAFWEVVEEKAKLLNPETTYGTFIWHCSELVANLNCVHSGLGYFNQEDEMLPVGLRFPIETRWIDGNLYITDPLINSDLEKGSEIQAINGQEVAPLVAEIFKHISSQAHIETTKAIIFNGYSTAYIPYALDFPNAYTITLKGAKEPISLKQLVTYSAKPRYFPTKHCASKDLCLDYADATTAVLTVINSGAYYGSRFSIFKEFMDHSFREIKNRHIENLIVDVRSNSGGPGHTAVYLLRYLLERPFVYKKLSEGSNIAGKTYMPFSAYRFKGSTYFLIDGEGGSTTGHLLAHIKASGRATLIGEELGGNHFCTGGQKRFQLENTGVFYSVGRYTHITTADDFNVNRGIMPDFRVIQPIEDYLDGKDTVMEFVLEHIRNR